MSTHPFDESYTEYLKARDGRSGLRRRVRGLYLAHQARQVEGPSIDFGCGLGPLLARLPLGSLGLDINASSIEHCRALGLPAEVYDPESDRYELRAFAPGRFRSLIAAHVFEHLEEPTIALRRLLQSARRLELNRVVIVVPGERGFRVDRTHRTFLTEVELGAPAVWEGTGFRVRGSHRFPFDWPAIDRWFTYQELHVVFERSAPRGEG